MPIRVKVSVSKKVLTFLASGLAGVVFAVSVANAERPAADFSQDPNPQALDQIMAMMTQERAASTALGVDRLAELSGLGVYRLPTSSPRSSGFSLFGISLGGRSGEDVASTSRAHAAQASTRGVSNAIETGATFNTAVLDSRPTAAGGSEWKCLTQALYFEARSETLAGQFAVGEVILNRASSPDFPNTICGVVSQGASHLHRCQFSYNCDGKSEHFTEIKAYKRAGKLAKILLDGRALVLTDGATYYHANNVKPRWAKSFVKTAQIGRHTFYHK